ncbi:MAG: HAD family phosphatase [Candidatus Omnitrophica bacterium]|nr:HAD family phosphatase [Candidatus Omnitrophota bacterium]MDD5429092.1 HAD family phosphatase [Candidatus Omnitrophota bacterium]
MKRALAFDLGNVLFNFDYTVALKKIQPQMKASVKDIMSALYDDDFALDFERGKVSPEEFYRCFCRKFSLDLGYDDFVDAWCKIFFPNPEMVKLIKLLSRENSLYLISNINELHYKYLNSLYGSFFLFFKSLILSFEVKAVKPEEKIYRVLEQNSGTTLSRIIYIDDRRDLIDEAKKIGLKCLHFKGYLTLCNELKAQGIPGLSGCTA